MAAEFCDGFKETALSDLISSRYGGGRLHLCQNPVSTGHAATLADFTEADFTGYANVSMNSWPMPALDGSFRAYSTHPDVTFTQTGTGTTNTVYGWYLTDSTGSSLICFEMNPAGGQAMNLTGLTYVVGVTLGDTNLSEP